MDHPHKKMVKDLGFAPLLVLSGPGLFFLRYRRGHGCEWGHDSGVRHWGEIVFLMAQERRPAPRSAVAFPALSWLSHGDEAEDAQRICVALR